VTPGVPARAARLLIALVAIGVNLPSLGPGFIHDDHRIIEQNELIRGPQNLARILTQGYWSVDEHSVPNLYRPVTILSFALNHALDGLRPLGYRALNLILHALASLLVLALARRVLGDGEAGRTSAAPLFAALLFATHPVHTEVLGEVIGRAELLAAAGSLGCVVSLLRSEELRRIGRARAATAHAALSVLLFAAAFFAKENAIAAPFLAVLAGCLVAGRRPRWSYYAAAGLALLVCLGARAAALGGLMPPPGQIHFLDNPIVRLPLLQGRWTALHVIARYALLLVAPARLCIDYSYNAIPAVRTLLDAGALLGMTMVVACAAGMALAWRRSPAVAFSLGFIGIPLLPVSNLLLPIGTIMAERLLYLPSVGFCLLAGEAARRLLAREGHGSPRPGTWPRAAGLAVLLAFSARSVLRLRDWRDDRTIFARALEVEPDSVRSLYNYGAASEDRGDDAAAMRVYRRALEIWPGFADAEYNLAGIHARQKEWEEAVSHYRRALTLQPGTLKYLVNLGRSLNALGRFSEARDLLEQAVAIDPRSVEAQTDLGAALLAANDPGGALRAYGEAARLDPANADYQRNLALAQQRAGDFAAAQESFRRGLALRPGDADLLAGLGLAMLDGGDAAGALEVLEGAARARPAHPIYPYQIGRALERLGRLAEAEEQYRNASRLAPASPVPLKALGLLLERRGDRAGAIAALERALALDPQGSVVDDATRRRLARLRAGR
jgi:protein O-mannosyl-transferase